MSQKGSNEDLAILAFPTTQENCDVRSKSHRTFFHVVFTVHFALVKTYGPRAAGTTSTSGLIQSAVMSREPIL